MSRLRSLFLRPLPLHLHPGAKREAACTMAAETISYQDLKKLTASGEGRIFDVRSPEEVSQGKIPNSINIPVDKVEAALKMDPETFQKTYLVKKPKPEDENVVFSLPNGEERSSGHRDGSGAGIHKGSQLRWRLQGMVGKGTKVRQVPRRAWIAPSVRRLFFHRNSVTFFLL